MKLSPLVLIAVESSLPCFVVFIVVLSLSGSVFVVGESHLGWKSVVKKSESYNELNLNIKHSPQKISQSQKGI